VDRQRGRLIPGEFLGEGAMGVIDARLPPALKPTLFDVWGDGAFFAMLLASLMGAAIPFRGERLVSAIGARL
jgi:hypothetical protein